MKNPSSPRRPAQFLPPNPIFVLEATRRMTDDLDEEASEAGRSVGGIYGKPAAEALTPDSQVAELYDPAVLQKGKKRRQRRKLRGLRRLWWRILRYALG